MKKYNLCILIHTVLFHLLMANAFSLPPRESLSAMQCKGEVVSIGCPMDEVLIKCGEPTAIDKIESGNIEEWTYNFSPRDLVYHLRFEDHILVKIESGEQGTW